MSKQHKRTSKIFDPIFNNEAAEVIRDDEGRVVAEVYLVPEYTSPKRKVHRVKRTKHIRPVTFTTDSGYKFFRWSHAK